MSDFTILRRRPPKHVCVRVGWPLLAEEIVGVVVRCGCGRLWQARSFIRGAYGWVRLDPGDIDWWRARLGRMIRV